jgi:hypothetical protein
MWQNSGIFVEKVRNFVKINPLIGIWNPDFLKSKKQQKIKYLTDLPFKLSCVTSVACAVGPSGYHVLNRFFLPKPGFLEFI